LVTTTDTRRAARPAPRVRAVEVRRVTTLSPQMVCVTLAGEELEGFEIAGPTGHRPYRLAEGAWQLIAGDETAFPAIGMIAEALPADAAGVVLLEAADAADFPELSIPTGVRVETLVRSGDVAGTATLEALGEIDLGPAPVQAWVAGEAVAIRGARKVLLDRGIASALLTTRGYWRYGEAGHPDHDMGED